MEEVKKKRGRPKKLQLPDEVQQIIDEVKQKEEEEIHQIVIEEKKKRQGEWDFKADDPIPYFDPLKSYELTGYRPITATEGLDFDPEWFMETRRIYETKNRYTDYKYGTKAYADFWDTQYLRCREGMTVNGYTITGDHYFFINFYRLEDLTSAKKAGGGRQYSFPNFFVAQYEYFHYIELCKRLRLNSIGLKARGVGFSEIAAAVVVNTYNCRPNTLGVVTAQQDFYVSKTLSKCWYQLEWLNDNTQGGFFKLRQKKNTEYDKKASVVKKVNGQDVEDGWMSEIVGIIADKPNKIRGDRTDILLYEESGSWPNWKKAFIQGDALVGIQGQKFGIKMAWGTGGDAGAALEGLADAYANPDVYDALAYLNRFTPSGEEQVTGYFIPAYAILNKEGYLDNRGWTDPVKAKEFYESERAKKLNDPKALVLYCAEYCFTAEEALALEGDNKFNKVNIVDQLTRIRVLKEGPKIETGSLDFTYKNSNHSRENITGVKWIPSEHGKVKIVEHPIWAVDNLTDEEGNPIPRPNEPIRDLYVAGVDGIDIGKAQTSEYTKDPSDFCIVIKKRVFGNQPPQYVAIYKDRPNDVREAYKIAIRLAMYYNAQINIEATRVSFLTWSKEHKFLSYFMKRPAATYPDINKRKASQYGSPATEAVISHQTDLIADYVNDYCYVIWFEEMLQELNTYTDENKRKFDIVAAMGEAELADEEKMGVVPKAIKQEPEAYEDVGYYTDENGIRRFGVIPKPNQNQVRYTTDFAHDNSINRTSDPRYR